MKTKILLILTCLCMAIINVDAQRGTSTTKIFKLAYAISSDGFVNVRTSPSASAQIVAKVTEPMYGLGNAVVLGYSGAWTKVKCDGKIGYAKSGYLEEMSWYTPGARKKIVAIRNAAIYNESMEDGGIGSVIYTAPAGTIIASDYSDSGRYYVLSTAHDNLFVKKSDVKIVYGR